MSSQQGGNGDMAVVESIKDALASRIGADRFRMWFAHGVSFQIDAPHVGEAESSESSTAQVSVSVRGQFALDRIRKDFLRELRAAAMQAIGARANVLLQLSQPPAEQAELPLVSSRAREDASGDREQPVDQHERQSGKRSRVKAVEISTLVNASRSIGETASPSPQQLDLPLSLNQPKSIGPAQRDGSKSGESAVHESDSSPPKVAKTVANFIAGSCNQLAYTATQMACENPSAASPLFLCGPTGVGKSHLLTAIADQLRRRHRMRRVIHLSAEQFTNDFITSVSNSGLPAFRRRYRDVDALLVDDVQFLGLKRATLREMLYTVETLAAAGRPLVFAGNQSPMEIPGLNRELAGRMAAGMVCTMLQLDATTRQALLRRMIDDRCPIAWPDSLISEINTLLAGDGRLVSGVVNLVAMLQRMYDRMPSMDEIRRFGGELLRAAKPAVTMSGIERAVCEAFQLAEETLRTSSQTRAVCEPRSLAIYLSRQLTSSAYAEIAHHFGGRSHSTAIAADRNVQNWLKQGKTIGRGIAAMSAQEAIDRVESILRTG